MRINSIIDTMPGQYSQNGHYHYRPKFNNLGIGYAHGMGCSRHDNCFTCPYSECRFSILDDKDRAYIHNPGDGIKVW